MSTTTTNNPSETVQTTDDAPHVHGPGCNHHHHHEHQEPYVRSAPKIGANDPCKCGSGKKYKKCCRSLNA